MAILIDGYNVLFAAGMIPRDVPPGSLAQARQWLIQRLLTRLDTATRHETVIVFDAKDAPKHVPDAYQVSGIQIFFARDHEEADDLIEQRIQREANPRKLLLITSDFRLRQLAQRRRAKAIKSEDWLEQTDDIEEPPAHAPSPPRPAVHRDQLLPAAEVERWMEDFRIASEPNETTSRTPTPTEKPAQAPKNPAVTPSPSPSQSPTQSPSSKKPLKQGPPVVMPNESRDAFDWGPFPPGYGEDLLD